MGISGKTERSQCKRESPNESLAELITSPRAEDTSFNIRPQSLQSFRQAAFRVLNLVLTGPDYLRIAYHPTPSEISLRVVRS